MEPELTTEEKYQKKIKYAIENLETLKNMAATTAQEEAIHFIEIDNNHEDSEKLKAEYHLKYKIAKTEVHSYARAISSIKTSIAYG